MKVVILAGGRGTRISEESIVKPKPMVEIGDHPILWHIMKGYSRHGLHDFILCLGYKGHAIKEYFASYALRHSDVTLDLLEGRLSCNRKGDEPWRITMVDTGLETQTGGRLKRVAHLLDPAEPFCLTYGDGLSDVDITALIEAHRSGGRLATVTAVQPVPRFGVLQLDGDRVTRFAEKPASDETFVNGGFFVFSPRILDYIDGDGTVLERDPLERLTRDGELNAFRHRGFWYPMDTLRDRDYLDSLWSSGNAPWKTWD